MIVILGRSGSGKNTVVKELLNYGLKSVVTYTTRPMRDGEENGVTYHFINTSTFFSLKDRGQFLENTEYTTPEGIWRYATGKDDVIDADKTSILIINPEGFRAIKRMLPKKELLSIYLDVDDTTLIDRLNHRGDKKIEVFRRYFTDVGMFTGIKHEVDYSVDNGDKLDTTVKSILHILKSNEVI